jgi:hypothetical protein
MMNPRHSIAFPGSGRLIVVSGVSSSALRELMAPGEADPALQPPGFEDSRSTRPSEFLQRKYCLEFAIRCGFMSDFSSQNSSVRFQT